MQKVKVLQAKSEKNRIKPVKDVKYTGNYDTQPNIQWEKMKKLEKIFSPAP